MAELVLTVRDFVMHLTPQPPQNIKPSDAMSVYLTKIGTVQSLKAAYQTTIDYIEAEANWYERHTIVHRDLATLFKISGVVLLVIAVLAPCGLLFNPLPSWLCNGKVCVWPTGDAAKFGYAAALAASAALLVDEVFLFSRSWQRFKSASFDLRTIGIQLHYSWTKLEHSKHQADTTQAWDPGHLDILAQAMNQAIAVRRQETEQWARESSRALDTLRERVGPATPVAPKSQ